MSLGAALNPIIVAATACLALLAGLIGPRTFRRVGPTWIGLAGLVASVVVSVLWWGNRVEALDGAYRADQFTHLFNIIFAVCAAAALIYGIRESAAVDRRGEFVTLVLSSTAGMMLVAGAGDLIPVPGDRIPSVAPYVLCALEVWRERSLEAGLKYLIIRAVGSSIFLYGWRSRSARPDGQPH